MRPRPTGELAEGEPQILAVVLDVWVAHEVKEPRIVRQDDTCKSLRCAIHAKRLPLRAPGRELAERPPLRDTFRVGNGDGIVGSLTDDEASSREAIEGRACLRAVDRPDHDQPGAPRRRGERGRQDPRVLIVACEHPEGIGPRRLERARIGEQFPNVADKPQLGTDLHDKAMLATP